jgi:16S rRNA G966 N2-methylase RsmD
MNKLYFGDNLDVMKRLYNIEKQKEFIDLIYIDPPFNSKILNRPSGKKQTRAASRSWNCKS